VAAPLEGLLYRSRIANRIGPLHMFLLVDRARRANRAADITGRLIYLDHSFMQYLEGPAPALEALWQLLQRDPRHYDVELLARYPLRQRRCPGSPMAFASNAYFRQYLIRDFSIAQAGDMEELLQACLQAEKEAAQALPAGCNADSLPG
jgi:hypothetical protein